MSRAEKKKNGVFNCESESEKKRVDCHTKLPSLRLDIYNASEKSVQYRKTIVNTIVKSVRRSPKKKIKIFHTFIFCGVKPFILQCAEDFPNN